MGFGAFYARVISGWKIWVLKECSTFSCKINNRIKKKKFKIRTIYEWALFRLEWTLYMKFQLVFKMFSHPKECLIFSEINFCDQIHLAACILYWFNRHNNFHFYFKIIFYRILFNKTFLLVKRLFYTKFYSEQCKIFSFNF